MTLREYLSIPYFLVMDSVQYGDEWLRRVGYIELEGCVVESYSPLEAMEEVEKLRIKLIVEKLRKGEPVPKTSEPLHSIVPELDLKRYGLTQFIDILDYDERKMASIGKQ